MESKNTGCDCGITSRNAVVLSDEKPNYTFYATTRIGRIQKMYALSQPIVTNDYLIRWAEM